MDEVRNESTAMVICDPNKCFGCQACRNVCPVSAIAVLSDEKGFLRPVVDQDKCNQCGLCIKVCPVEKTEGSCQNVAGPHVYAAWIKNSNIRMQSTSGGLFYAIASYVIDQGGVVFGARWTDDWQVAHDYCLKREDLCKFVGSKYIQSDIGNCYSIVKRFLTEGRSVLFSGTPCQVAGLKTFLQKTYDNLLCVDLVCHGVPSHAVFKKYLQMIETGHKDKVTDIKLRHKEPLWSSCSVRIAFKRAEPYLSRVQVDPFFAGFTSNVFLRISCYTCPYATVRRQGDLTIADYWGYVPSGWRYTDFDRGCSLVLANSSLGEKTFSAISRMLVYEEKTIEDAIRGNPSLQHPFFKAGNSDAFWQDFRAGMEFTALARKHFTFETVPKITLLYRMRNHYRCMIPSGLIALFKYFRKQLRRS